MTKTGFCCSRCGLWRRQDETTICPACQMTRLVVPLLEFLPLETGTTVRLRVRPRQGEPADEFRFDNTNDGEIADCLRSTDNGQIIYRLLTAGVFASRRHADAELWVWANEVEPLESDADEDR